MLPPLLPPPSPFLWINVFKTLFITKVDIELSANLKPKTVYKMCSIYILGIFYARKIILLLRA